MPENHTYRKMIILVQKKKKQFGNKKLQGSTRTFEGRIPSQQQNMVFSHNTLKLPFTISLKHILLLHSEKRLVCQNQHDCKIINRKSTKHQLKLYIYSHPSSFYLNGAHTANEQSDRTIGQQEQMLNTNQRGLQSNTNGLESFPIPKHEWCTRALFHR